MKVQYVLICIFFFYIPKPFNAITFLNSIILEISMNFSIEKEELIKIVSSCQERSYD